MLFCITSLACNAILMRQQATPNMHEISLKSMTTTFVANTNMDIVGKISHTKHSQHDVIPGLSQIHMIGQSGFLAEVSNFKRAISLTKSIDLFGNKSPSPILHTHCMTSYKAICIFYIKGFSLQAGSNKILFLTEVFSFL